MRGVALCDGRSLPEGGRVATDVGRCTSTRSPLARRVTWPNPDSGAPPSSYQKRSKGKEKRAARLSHVASGHAVWLTSRERWGGGGCAPGSRGFCGQAKRSPHQSRGSIECPRGARLSVLPGAHPPTPPPPCRAAVRQAG